MWNKTLNLLTLLGSTSTLVCCAIPSLLVSLGAGATLVGVLGVFPQLIWLSDHKYWLFGFSTLMLSLSGWAIYRSSQLACPIDPHLRDACQETKSWSKPLYLVSLGLFLIGAFVTFVAPIVF